MFSEVEGYICQSFELIIFKKYMSIELNEFLDRIFSV